MSQRRKKTNKSGSIAQQLSQIVANTRDSRNYEPPNTPDIIWRMAPPRTTNVVLSYEYGTQIQYAAVAGVYTSGAISFTLNNAPTYSNFTACFDQYRIALVRCKFTWYGISGTNPNPPLITCLDYDDATTPTLEQQVADRPSSMTCPPAVSFERVLQPHCAVAVYGGAFTSFGNKAMQWCDSAYPGVLWYGLKYYLPAAVTAQVAWNVQISMHIQFRNQL